MSQSTLTTSTVDNGTRDAKVKGTDKTITVYKHKSTGNWIDYQDCTTSYTEDQLEFIK